MCMWDVFYNFIELFFVGENNKIKLFSKFLSKNRPLSCLLLLDYKGWQVTLSLTGVSFPIQDWISSEVLKLLWPAIPNSLTPKLQKKIWLPNLFSSMLKFIKVRGGHPLKNLGWWKVKGGHPLKTFGLMKSERWAPPKKTLGWGGHLNADSKKCQI